MKYILVTIMIWLSFVSSYAQQNSATTKADTAMTVMQARSGINLEKTVYVTVGKSVSLHPWSVVSSHASGYSCVSTSLRSVSDKTAMSVTAGSKTQTRYPSINGDGYSKGFYCSYYVKTLKSGSYTVLTHVHCCKREGFMPVTYVDADYFITYHVVISEQPKVESITIPTSLTMKIGDSYQFDPKIYEEGAETTLSWYSDNPTVASVTGEGLVKARSCGQAIITCTASNGVSARCVVDVAPIYVHQIELSAKELELQIGDRANLTAHVLPSEATTKSIQWSSSNENVAFVSDEGMVIGISSGYCNIRATATDGSGVYASCLVHVKDAEVDAIIGTPSKQNELSCKDGCLIIAPQHTGTFKIYDMQGALIKEIEVKQGETFQMHLPTRVYIVNGHKLQVR